MTRKRPVFFDPGVRGRLTHRSIVFRRKESGFVSVKTRPNALCDGALFCQTVCFRERKSVTEVDAWGEIAMDDKETRFRHLFDKYDTKFIICHLRRNSFL
jgi:hypothetical protein